MRTNRIQSIFVLICLLFSGFILNNVLTNLQLDGLTVYAQTSNNINVILPWGEQTQWQMKYYFKEQIDNIPPSQDNNGNQWYDINYDDSNWETLTGPMGSEVYDFSGNRGFECNVELSCYYLRRTFDLPYISDDIYYFQLWVDDVAIVYINGVKVMEGNFDNNETGNISIIPKNLLNNGDNTLAVYIDDNIGNDFGFDYTLFTSEYPFFFTDDQGVIYKLNNDRYSVIGHTEDISANIIIPEQLFGFNVSSISDDAFLESSIQSISISAAINEIGSESFAWCSSLNSIIVDGSNAIYDSRNNCNAIIETDNNRLIKGCVNTIIPDGIKIIGYRAFQRCDNLKTITLPNSVEIIEDWAFAQNDDLESFIIPEGVTYIGDGAIWGCYNLKTIDIAASVSFIDNEAFRDNPSLSTIYMRSSIPPQIDNPEIFIEKTYESATLYVPYGSKQLYEQTEGWRNFQNIVELEEGGDTKPSTYTDSQGVNYQLINNETAYKVTGHSDNFNLNLIIPAELFDLPVIEIGTFAFQYSALQSIVIPEGLTTIGRNAFHSCDLSSIHIPASVTSLYPETDNCFSANPRLNSITVAEGNSVYDSRDNCNAIIETSSNRLLTGCLGTIIPTSIPTIANDAFYGASFASVTIPANIQSIGAISFGSCNELISFKVLSETPFSIDSRIFDESEHNVFEYATLYVPKGSKTLYEQANVWRNFQNIVEFEDGGSTEPEDGVLQPDGTTTWTTFQGVKMTFKVIDAEKKWVQVGNGVDPSISQATTGEVTIPNEIVIDGETYTVVGIGDYGFYNCDKLTAIWLPENLQFIGKYAFYGCKLVGKIQIPETVYAIDDTAFEGCTGLTEISCPYIPGFSYPSVPDLIIIGYKPSDEDYDVVIPQPVTSIGERAFSNCANIRTMRVEEGNAVFDSRDNCNAIIRTADNVLLFGCKSTVIPSSVTAIDAYAFEGHTGLSTIAIPASIASIGQGAFADCTGLTTVTSNIQNPYAINDNTFSTTTYETATLKVPHGTKSAYLAADGWKNFFNIVEQGEGLEVLETGSCGDNLTYTIYKDLSMVISGSGAMWDYNSQISSNYMNVVRTVIIEDGVTSIGQRAFFNYRDIQTLVISHTVTSIGRQAFYYTKLNSLTIPNSVTSIGDDAFYGKYFNSIVVESDNPIFDSRDNCNAVIETATNTLIIGCKNTVIPNSIISIGDFAFHGCQDLASLSIPNSVTSIGYGAFYDCYDLASITIPNSVISIGDAAFFYCSSLSSINIPNSVTSIGEHAFCYCRGLTSLTIPQSVTSIGTSALSHCSGLSSIIVDEGNSYFDSRNGCNAIIETATNTLLEGCMNTVIPSSVTSIRNNAFFGRTGLTSITIPSSVSSIGDDPFCFCSGLSSIVVEVGNPRYDSRDNCNALIETSTNKLISGCKNTVIPDGIVTIVGDAFRGCSAMTSVSIPSSVTSIQGGAFEYCSVLSEITVKSVTPPTIYRYSFNDNIKSSCTLYVPKGSKSAYENADYWNAFENIVEYDSEPDTDISVLDNAIYIEQVDGRIGGTKDIKVKMKNDFDVRGFQFTMELPEGTTINSWTLAQDRLPEGTTMNKVLADGTIEGNQINVGCALNDGMKTFTGNDGTIATVNVTFAEDMEEGSYPIYLTHNSISDASGQTQLVLSDIKATLVLEDYVTGDTNGDGMVLIGDVITILNYIIGVPSDNFNVEAADVNGDGMVLIGDVIAVLNIIVNQ